MRQKQILIVAHHTNAVGKQRWDNTYLLERNFAILEALGKYRALEATTAAATIAAVRTHHRGIGGVRTIGTTNHGLMVNGSHRPALSRFLQEASECSRMETLGQLIDDLTHDHNSTSTAQARGGALVTPPPCLGGVTHGWSRLTPTVHPRSRKGGGCEWLTQAQKPTQK